MAARAEKFSQLLLADFGSSVGNNSAPELATVVRELDKLVSCAWRICEPASLSSREFQAIVLPNFSGLNGRLMNHKLRVELHLRYSLTSVHVGVTSFMPTAVGTAQR